MDIKLHCNHCGKKRTMVLGFLMRKPESKDKEREEVAFIPVRVKGLLKNKNNPQIPKAYVGQCSVCNGKTFYQLIPHLGKNYRTSLVMVG